MAYSVNGRVRYSEVDREANLTIDALIDYFQDCSAFQSEDGHVGIDYLKEQGEAWMICTWEIVIQRLPRIGEKITTSTWAHGLKGFYGIRNYTMETETGERLAFANAVWVYMDLTKQKPKDIPPNMQAVFPIEPVIEYPWSGRKLKMAKQGEPQEPIIIGEEHLDTNCHVNNGQYVLMAEHYLPEEFKVKKLQVVYKKQALLGDIIIPEVHREENMVTVLLKAQDKKLYSGVCFEA